MSGPLQVNVDLDDPMKAGREFAVGVVNPLLREMVKNGDLDHNDRAKLFAGFLAAFCGCMAGAIGVADADVVLEGTRRVLGQVAAERAKEAH